ncbi:MAG: patatin-like phospholipase family protein [Myxococcales bacterium]|nr:patatin-like phospholipase family protein [Myxococcales bacterium]
MAAQAQPPKVKRAIILAGGGARGAYEAGVLNYLFEELPNRLGKPIDFDVVCGTSVGAIHAAFLAATADRESGRGDLLKQIWDRMRVDEIFRFTTRDMLQIPGRLLGVRRVARQLREGQRPDRLYGLLDTRPLERLVLESIPWRGIRRNLRAGLLEAVCVTTTQIATGHAVVFVEQKERSLPHWASQGSIRMQPIRLSPMHTLASAAIPMLFPAVRLGSRYYADGGLRLNTPLAPAVRLGANRVLVIGTGRNVAATESEELAQQRTEGFGNPLFLAGKVLNALMLSPVDSDLARLHLINRFIKNGEMTFGEDFLEKVNATSVATGDGRPLQKIHDLVIRPSQDLGIMAGQLLTDSRNEFSLSPFLRVLMRMLGTGAEARESDLLSYLLFDKAYARPLIELGHRDAREHEDELARFFSDDPM